MIQLPNTNLFIGNINDLRNANDQDWAFVVRFYFLYGLHNIC